jgi:uncharacterized protein YjbJ (UPF0337 family)
MRARFAGVCALAHRRAPPPARSMRHAYRGSRSAAGHLQGIIAMNWDRIEGNWKQLKGNAKQHWGKLTDDQLEVISGKRDLLAGKIQEAYGISKEEVEKQLAAWELGQEDTISPSGS